MRFTKAGVENIYEQSKSKLLKHVGTVNAYDEFERHKGTVPEKLPKLTDLLCRKLCGWT